MSDQDNLLGFLYACPVGLVEFDASGAIALINPHAMKHMMPLAGAAGVANFFDAMEQHAPELRNLVEGFVETSGAVCDGHRIYVDLGQSGANGASQVLSCSVVKLGPDRVMATLSDISAQVAQETRLQQADTWFSALIDGINDFALLTISGDGAIVSTNGSFTRQTGYAVEDVIGRPMRDILNGPDNHLLSIDDQLSMALRDGWTLFEGRETRANGDTYWCQRLVVARDDGDGDGSADPSFAVVLRDVPARESSTKDLFELLTRDHLTGAANRRHFHKALRREQLRWQSQGQPFALVMLDLDHFKWINDAYGHPAGDTVLHEVARIGLSLTPSNALFARLGGEEFVFLLPGLTLTEAGALAEEVRVTMSQRPIPVSDHEVNLTVSLGCAEIAEVEGSTDALIALADQRLYQAKKAGRDQVFAEAS